MRERVLPCDAAMTPGADRPEGEGRAEPVSALGAPPPPSASGIGSTPTGLPVPALLIGFSVTYAFALYAGYMGSGFCTDLYTRIELFGVMAAIVGVCLVVGVSTGVVQTVLLYRGFGIGRWWAVGTAIGGALGGATFVDATLSGDFGVFNDVSPELAPGAMGAVIGLGQIIASGRVRLAPHVLVCAGATTLWFAMLTQLQESARGMFTAVGEPDLVLAVVPSLISGGLAAFSLWLLLRWDAAAQARR